MKRTLALLLLAPVLAGCLGGEDGDDGMDDGSDDPPTPAGYTPFQGQAGTAVYYARLDDGAYSFTSSLMDDTRAGGEPVITVTKEGTILVASHPGWTHVHPGEDPRALEDLFVPASGQSYLWRSTDGGETWSHIGLPGMEEGPRSEGSGFSDPDFTYDEDADRIWYTDLQALAEQSVSFSDDDGQTWTAGNAVAGAGPYVDRQWMASHDGMVYLTANYFEDRSGGTSEDGARPISTTYDDGLTWETIGYAPCGGDMLTDPADGALIIACGLGFAISTDNAASFTVHNSSLGRHEGFFAHEPAIDTAGGIYLAANGQPLTPHDPNTVLVSYSPDRGGNWKVLDLRPFLNEIFGQDGTHVFAWVSAGSPGRAAVSWIAAPGFTGQAPEAVDQPWYVYTAFLAGMDTDTPTVDLVQVTPDPIHYGPMCQSGTTCQVQSIGLDPVMGTDTGDRRMGDFFETTLDHEGDLLMAFADTQSVSEDVLSHPRFAKQVAGPRLLAEGHEWPAGWPTQG